MYFNDKYISIYLLSYLFRPTYIVDEYLAEHNLVNVNVRYFLCFCCNKTKYLNVTLYFYLYLDLTKEFLRIFLHAYSATHKTAEYSDN